MESSTDMERGAGKNKRKWSELEDEKLIEALLELVNNGTYKADNGFKPGYLGFLESTLQNKLPDSAIKAKPHIESRIKTLKTNFQTVYDLRYGNTSGFGWDPENQVVTAPKDVWDAYIKANVRAAKWKHTPFPWFDDLSIVFGKDRAMGRNAESVVEVDEEINALENAVAQGGRGDFADDGSGSFMEPPHSDESTGRKRQKKNKNDIDPMSEVMISASKLIASQFENSTKILAAEFEKSTRMLIAAEEKKMEKKEKLMDELSKIAYISVVEKFQVAKKMADNENLMVLFFGATDEEKDELVHAILRGDIY